MSYTLLIVCDRLICLYWFIIIIILLNTLQHVMIIVIMILILYFIGDLCISPSHGTIQSGGILTVTGPPLNLQLKNHRIRIRFEGENEVLYTQCIFTAVPVNSAVLCPVPLFSPNSAGVKNVTLLIGDCETGYTGKYRLGERQYTFMK